MESVTACKCIQALGWESCNDNWLYRDLRTRFTPRIVRRDQASFRSQRPQVGWTDRSWSRQIQEEQHRHHHHRPLRVERFAQSDTRQHTASPDVVHSQVSILLERHRTWNSPSICSEYFDPERSTFRNTRRVSVVTTTGIRKSILATQLPRRSIASFCLCSIWTM